MNTVAVLVSELTGPALDWAVAKCEYPAFESETCTDIGNHRRYSLDWSQGGPIIGRELISTDWDNDCWNASVGDFGGYSSGPTALIAAMRCYVVSKLGGVVDIPAELVAQ
jgi:hypothetical protein